MHEIKLARKFSAFSPLFFFPFLLSNIKFYISASIVEFVFKHPDVEHLLFIMSISFFDTKLFINYNFFCNINIHI